MRIATPTLPSAYRRGFPLLRGNTASRVGAWNNDCWLPSADYPSIARLVKSRGYEAFLTGKMHYDKTRRYGFTEIGQVLRNQATKTGKAIAAPSTTPALIGRSGGPASASFAPGEHRKCSTMTARSCAHACDFLANRKSIDPPFSCRRLPGAALALDGPGRISRPLPRAINPPACR